MNPCMSVTGRVAAALVLGLVAAPVPGQDPPARRLRVVATLPVLADVARQVGGAAVTVEALARGSEDPHYVIATPSLMARIHKADLFIETGLSLETWVESALAGARNPGVRRGAPGNVMVATGVPRLGVPTLLTRAAGDIHPDGNPHIWFDPINVRQIAANITAGLSRVAPDRRALFERRLAAYRQRLDVALFGRELVDLLGGDVLVRLARAGKLAAFLGKTFHGKTLRERLGGWLRKAAPLRGRKVVFYHEAWAYFVRRFGLVVVGYVEDKPGILPSAAHRDELVAKMTETGCRLVASLEFYDDTVPRALARATGARLVLLPGDVGGQPGVGDYFALVDRLVDSLLGAKQD